MTILVNFLIDAVVLIVATTMIDIILKMIKDLRREPKLKPVPIRVPIPKYPPRKSLIRSNK